MDKVIFYVNKEENLVQINIKTYKQTSEKLNN